MTDFETRRARLNELERVPVLGQMAVDAFDAWLGLVDAMYLGGLRSALLKERVNLSPEPLRQDDRLSPQSAGSPPSDDRAKRHLPLSRRAA